MAYYFSKTVDYPFEETVEKTKGELKKEGFGILTKINVKQALKEKLNENFRKYIILGACNPSFALKALQEDDKIGLMLPCNVIVQNSGETKSEVAAVDPIESMKAVENEKLGEVAVQVREKLKKVIGSI